MTFVVPLRHLGRNTNGLHSMPTIDRTNMLGGRGTMSLPEMPADLLAETKISQLRRFPNSETRRNPSEPIDDIAQGSEL